MGRSEEEEEEEKAMIQQRRRRVERWRDLPLLVFFAPATANREFLFAPSSSSLGEVDEVWEEETFASGIGPKPQLSLSPLSLFFLRP